MKLSIRLLLALLASLMLMSETIADSHEADATTPESILVQADVAWASAATNKEMEQFYARILEDAVLLAPNAPIAEGPESFGTYELSFDGPGGVRIVDNGKYMTVWKKGTDGSWKVAADMFNTSLPLPTMEEAGK